MQITITLTDAEAQALSYNHTDFDFYVNSVAIGQVNLATDEIVKVTVQHCLDNGVAIPATRDEIVAYAFANGVVKTAAERQSDSLASMGAANV